MTRFIVVSLLAISLTLSAQEAEIIPSPVLLGNQTPTRVAMILADSAVPSGIEIKSEDDVIPRMNSASNPGGNGKITASEFLRYFNSRNRDYHASFDDAVIVIRPVKGSLEALDQLSPIVSLTTVTGVTAAL